MKTSNRLILTTSPPTQSARKLRSFVNIPLRHLRARPRLNITGKERDNETGLYYYGARYLDPKASRWLSGDPAVGEYIPSAPVNEEARKRNGNLPGMGGVFNYVNLHVYHYGGNNPVKYVDPDGRDDVYFLYVYNANDSDDQRNKNYERWSINHVVQYMKNNRLSVTIIEAASKADIQAAFADPDAIMIITSGHGNDKPEINTADGLTFSPSDIITRRDFLSTVIFENCYQGDYLTEWGAALEGVEIIGWQGLTYVHETILFNRFGLFDRQSRQLMNFAENAVRIKRDIISMPVRRI